MGDYVIGKIEDLGYERDRKEMLGKLKLKIEDVLPYWADVQLETMKYIRAVHAIEKKMCKNLKNKNLEFVYGDGDVVGIGDYSIHKLLFHDSDLDKFIRERE